MRINADFSKRVVVHSSQMEWVQSPMPGVERRMLDRIGEEVARATSIVRYAPGSSFSAHTHDGGEEFLVLEGVFQDEHGDYPIGSYVRNPPTSSHTPGSEPGCVILVKLHQFDPTDRFQVRISSSVIPPIAVAGRNGVGVISLYADAREDVRIEVWDPATGIRVDAPGGMEVFVLDDGFDEGGESFSKHSWLRVPPGDTLHTVAGAAGARVWIKSGHLRDVSC
jgi:ChrR Cupin-like domain